MNASSLCEICGQLFTFNLKVFEVFQNWKRTECKDSGTTYHSKVNALHFVGRLRDFYSKLTNSGK